VNNLMFANCKLTRHNWRGHYSITSFVIAGLGSGINPFATRTQHSDGSFQGPAMSTASRPAHALMPWRKSRPIVKRLWTV
jgi:hypothetical protein